MTLPIVYIIVQVTESGYEEVFSSVYFATREEANLALSYASTFAPRYSFRIKELQSK